VDSSRTACHHRGALEPLDQRLARLAPEQVLRAYAPEQVLRALSEDYLATLPPETRAAIQKRLGAVAAPPRKPARRRRSS
jgi:hypothetical protein